MQIDAPCTLVRLVECTESSMNEFNHIITGIATKYVPTRTLSESDLIAEFEDDVPF